MFTGHWTLFCFSGIHSLSTPQVSFKILSHIILSYRHLSSGGSSNVQEITVNLTLRFVTQHATKAHGGVDGRTALLFLNLESRWGKKVQLYAPTTLLPGKKQRYPFKRKPGWAPEPVWVLYRKDKRGNVL